MATVDLLFLIKTKMWDSFYYDQTNLMSCSVCPTNPIFANIELGLPKTNFHFRCFFYSYILDVIISSPMTSKSIKKVWSAWPSIFVICLVLSSHGWCTNMVPMNIPSILQNSNEIEITWRFYRVARFLNQITCSVT